MLQQKAETLNIPELAALFGKTQNNIKKVMYQHGIVVQTDLLTLGDCVRQTGYGEYALNKARKALGQKWKLPWKRGADYGISEGQLDAMVNWLKVQTWKYQNPEALRKERNARRRADYAKKKGLHSSARNGTEGHAQEHEAP